jgi:hypothetical protein
VIEFLNRPYEDQGKLVTLDAWSIPNTFYEGRVLQYARLPERIAVQSGTFGVRFSSRISSNVLLYDVLVDDPDENAFLEGKNLVVVGHLAIRMSGPDLSPDPFQLWDVEPLGTIEATAAGGVVIRIPLVRFWHYHESGLDAQPPVEFVVPPQNYNQATPQGGVRAPNNPSERLSLENENYSQNRDKILQLSDYAYLGSMKPLLLNMVSDADRLRGHVAGPLASAISRGESPGSYSILEADEFSVDVFIEQVAAGLENPHAAQEHFARDLPKLLADLNSQYNRTLKNSQEFRREPDGPPLCRIDPSELSQDLSAASKLIDQAKDEHTSADTFVRWVRIEYAWMLVGAVNDRIVCHSVEALPPVGSHE